MSLPDTVFIFVLALIIFGPKKLPEIGRQLGKLVGEFRRASNEFKFQIEEELRQAELTDRNTITPAKKEVETPALAESSTEAPPDSHAPDLPYPEETLPVGQYPNIDTVNPQDLNPPESTEVEAAPVSAHGRSVDESEPSHLAITPAAGTEPRTAHPYTTTTADSDASPVAGEGTPMSESLQTVNDTSLVTDATSHSNHEPADPYAAPAVADVTHG